MVLSSLFNTLQSDLICPHCQKKIISGIGFKVGSLKKTNYKVGDILDWQSEPRRPEKRPKQGNITTLGHFNCDNTKCPSWQDCYPDIQTAKIIIEKDRIIDITICTDALAQEQFAILQES